MSLTTTNTKTYLLSTVSKGQTQIWAYSYGSLTTTKNGFNETKRLTTTKQSC